MTNASSGIVAALYASDPSVASTIFTQIALVDSGDHLTWQAAYGSRYWDKTQTLLIEKQVHHVGGWVDITSSCIVNFLQGKITVSAVLNADDYVRATGKRMVLVNVADAYGMEPEITNQMSRDVSGYQLPFSEFIPLKGSWKATAHKWFVDFSYLRWILENPSVQFVVKMYNLYANSSGDSALVGFCKMARNTIKVPDNDVMTEDWELQGDSKDGLFWEVRP